MQNFNENFYFVFELAKKKLKKMLQKIFSVALIVLFVGMNVQKDAVSAGNPLITFIENSILSSMPNLNTASFTCANGTCNTCSSVSIPYSKAMNRKKLITKIKL